MSQISLSFNCKVYFGTDSSCRRSRRLLIKFAMKNGHLVKSELEKRFAGVAQLVEHLTCNEEVTCSKQVAGSILLSAERFY